MRYSSYCPELIPTELLNCCNKLQMISTKCENSKIIVYLTMFHNSFQNFMCNNNNNIDFLYSFGYDLKYTNFYDEGITHKMNISGRKICTFLARFFLFANSIRNNVSRHF